MIGIMKQLIIISYLLSLAKTTINSAWNFGLATDRLVAMSAGDQHLTLVYAPNNDLYIRSLAMYNVSTNVSKIITYDMGFVTTKIKQIRGVNTLSTNTWLMQYVVTTVSSQKAVVSSINHTYMPSSWSRNINLRNYNIFGSNTNITYQLDSTTGCQLNKKLGISNASIIISSTPSYTCYGLYYSSSIIYALMYQTSTLMATLKFYNATTTTQTLITTYSFVTPALYSNIFITAGPSNYYTLAYGTKIEIYYSLNRSIVCNISLSANVFDIKISDSWLYVSTTTYIRQQKADTCMQFAQAATTVGYYLQYHLARTGVEERLFAWTNTTGGLKVMNVLNRYTCAGGCSVCMSMYGLDDATKECYYTGIPAPTTTNTTTNTTNTTANSTTNTTTNITNTTINTTNTTKTTTNTTSNTTTNTTTNTNSNTTLNTTTNSSSQPSEPPVISISQQTFCFLNIKDAQLFQSIKAFYSVYVPVTFIIFCIIHRMFYWLYNWKISKYLRLYSFWLHFIVLLFMVNSSKLCYYSFSYMNLIFSFNIQYTVIHAISITFIGIFFISLLSLVFLSQIFYGQLSKYFLINVYRIQYAYILTFFCFSVRPILQASIHVFYFTSPQLQLSILSYIQILYLFIVICCQFKLDIFKYKLVFIMECIVSFCIVIINFLLMLKHFKYFKDDTILENIEEPIQCVACFASMITGVCLIHPFLTEIFNIIKKTLIYSKLPLIGAKPMLSTRTIKIQTSQQNIGNRKNRKKFQISKQINHDWNEKIKYVVTRKSKDIKMTIINTYTQQSFQVNYQNGDFSQKMKLKKPTKIKKYKSEGRNFLKPIKREYPKFQFN